MANIKCGKCRGTHESVQAVKSCYAGQKVTAPATGERRTVEHVRSNKYAGPCSRCGNRVGEREGRIEKDDGRWLVSHLAGQCPATASPAPATSERRDFSVVTGGYYATVSATGRNDYDFWYVKEGRKPGYRFVKRYIGGSGPIRISGGEAIRALTTILEEGVEKCGLRFADEHQRCWKCGLPLTDELSRSRRQGPVCWAK